MTFAPRYDRKEVFGGTAATNFGPLVLRMEAGWNARKAAAVITFPPQSGFEKFGQFSGVVGLWAAVAPHSFYDDFPGGGRHWVAVDGPFSFFLCGIITSSVSSGHRRLGDMAATSYVVGRADAGRSVVVPTR